MGRQEAAQKPAHRVNSPRNPPVSRRTAAGGARHDNGGWNAAAFTRGIARAKANGRSGNCSCHMAAVQQLRSRSRTAGGGDTPLPPLTPIRVKLRTSERASLRAERLCEMFIDENLGCQPRVDILNSCPFYLLTSECKYVIGYKNLCVATNSLPPTGVLLVPLVLWSSQDEQGLVTCPE